MIEIPRKGNGKAPADDRPVIVYDPTDIKRMAREAEAALLARGGAVYQQDGKARRVVRLDQPSESRAARRDAGAVILYPASAVWLRGEFMSAVRWVKWKEDKDGNRKMIRVPISREVAEHYLEMVDEWRLPVLRGTVETPTLWRRGDGFEVLQKPGYDPASGLYFDPGKIKFPLVPAAPTRADAEAALARFLALLVEFPFVPDEVPENWEPKWDEGRNKSRNRSVVVSAWLTGLVRRDMDAAPLHAFDAVTPSSGKGYLVRVISTILTGRRAAAMPWVRNEEEQRKRLLSVLMEGDPIVLLDNATTPIGGTTLNIALTEPILRDRVLGKSATRSALTNCLMLATGNALEFENDTTRRVARCQMDPRQERPQDRQFEGDPLADAQRARAELVVGGLTILLAYINAGRPEKGNVKHVGSYEDWTLIREAIVWLGQPDPADTMKAISADDPVANEVRQVMAEWDACYGSRATKLSEAVKNARAAGDKVTGHDGHDRRLWEAMQAATHGQDPNEVRMGRWFKKHENRIFGGRRFVRSGDEHVGRSIALLKGLGAAPTSGAFNTPITEGKEVEQAPNDEKPPPDNDEIPF